MEVARRPEGPEVNGDLRKTVSRRSLVPSRELKRKGYIAAELVNHASQPAEECLANMESCESRLSTKIVDNQLDAWLRFCVNAYKCNNTRDRGHVTACAQRRCCAASVGELYPLIVGERKDSV